MTTEEFMTLLLICSVVTGLFTEAVKKVIESQANIIAGVIAIIVSACVYVTVVIAKNIPVTSITVIAGIALCALAWLCSMLGYDKVIQALKGIKL